MRRAVSQLGIFSFVLLLLGVVFVPSRVIHASEPTLTMFFMEGLTFETVPHFEKISFSYTQESIHTLEIETTKYEEVNLDSFSFPPSETPVVTAEIASAVLESATSSLTPSPTEQPSPTPTATPLPTATPTPTIEVTPTAVPTATPTPTPIGDEVWDTLAKCEAGGNWAIDTGNGYFGGLQFTQSAWESVGGSGSPSLASREEQIEKGKKLQAVRGWGAWGACARKLNLL